MQGDKEAEAAETRRRENDAQVIAAMRKKVARRVFRSVAAVAAAAAIVCGAVLAYVGVGRPATTADVSLSAKEEYWEVVVELEDGTLRASTGEEAAAGSCGQPRNKP